MKNTNPFFEPPAAQYYKRNNKPAYRLESFLGRKDNIISDMSPQTLIGEQNYNIRGLGTVKGLLYANGVRQFCGVPYARLAKRWTQSTLATSWKDNYHGGTKLG